MKIEDDGFNKIQYNIDSVEKYGDYPNVDLVKVKYFIYK